jgi:hypothetical protein
MVQNIVSVSLFAIVAISFYTVVCRLIASGGWKWLADDYQATVEPSGHKFRRCSVDIGRAVNYMTCVIVAEEGLYVRIGRLPLLLFHPPLLIPWNAMKPGEDEHSVGSFGTLRLLVCTSRRHVNLLLRGIPAVAIGRKYHVVVHGFKD